MTFINNKIRSCQIGDENLLDKLSMMSAKDLSKLIKFTAPAVLTQMLVYYGDSLPQYLRKLIIDDYVNNRK